MMTSVAPATLDGKGPDETAWQRSKQSETAMNHGHSADGDYESYTEYFCDKCERENNLRHVERTTPASPLTTDPADGFYCDHHGEIGQNVTAFDY